MLAAIGLAAALSQLVSAQAPASDGSGVLAAAESRDDFLGRKMRAAFVGRDVDLAAGWDVAATLGPAACPVLWRLLDGLAAGESRYAVLGALCAAGGAGEDERMLRWIDAPGRSSRDRLFVAYLLALGPDRTSPRANLLARLRGQSDLSEVVALMAVARFPGPEGMSEVSGDGDLGRAAAALFAGSPLRAAPPRGERHEGLFWRGAFLGAARNSATATLRNRAMAWQSEPGDGAAATRRAALWLLAQSGQGQAWTVRPDDDTLEVLTGDPLARRNLAAWLTVPPRSRSEPSSALVVAHVLASPLADLLATRPEWAARPEGRPAALALAFRALVEGASGQPPPWPEVPEWAMVRLACGSRDPVPPGVADAPAGRAAALFAAGRLPAADFADALELAVWRAGAHTGLVPWRLERELLRDLVLAGSQEGGGKYQPHVPTEQRYFAKGLDRDEPWYDVAVAFFEWSSRPRGPVPATARWPRAK